MKTHARVVAIGGGVVGVSTLYHLAKMVWSDVVLVERRERLPAKVIESSPYDPDNTSLRS